MPPPPSSRAAASRHRCLQRQHCPPAAAACHCTSMQELVVDAKAPSTKRHLCRCALARKGWPYQKHGCSVASWSLSSSSSATAAEVDCVKVDNGVELSSSSCQHLSLLPGDRLEGRDMQQRSLDCLHCCDGGWRRPWLAVAAGGMAMALSAGGDKKGGQLQSVSVFVTHDHRGGKHYTNFANAMASTRACIIALRKILIPLSRE